MFRLRPLLNRNTITIFQLSLSPTPKCYPFLKPHPYPSSISLKCFSTTSHQQPFIISYLTNNCGFSPQAALKASKNLYFDTSQKPDSVIAFFRDHGFSLPQIHNIIGRIPNLLVCNPIKRVLPKFEFLAPKGASPSDIVTMVTRSPRFLRSSLENHIIPAFELVRRFFPSDRRAIVCVIACPSSIVDPRLEQNVNLLLEFGVSPSNIRYLLCTRTSILCSAILRKVMEEIKGLGFDPSKINFIVALLAERAVTKSQWDAKVDTLKTWGWSEDAISHAFKKDPCFMIRSTDKLNAVMSFWIRQLGWDPSPLLAFPILFGYSLEKRLIPRASVVQYLLSKGLMKNGASLATPFRISDELFLQRFVNCFEKEEASRLLRLYQGGC
ncbi:Transcription termination factor, mitochondrial/chloroplastic [Sesbania bispinosa]|nr:Transcription termination factor, mitochondrial/chloroplastic [Sesbania bispinosa]